ncbi:glycosyltransferase family 9 protein [Aliiglaciecola sp. SL4]|uniref:glycosyltransferase family 9 protein n=1 Tax=Aliiglaciecola sp. SL4 TaxID=3239806 RepID=UPI00355BA415
MNVKKLCLLRLSAIGDVCHAVAMVDRIIKHAPDIQITWIIGKVEYQLLKGMPNVRFIIFDKKLGKEAYVKLKADLNGETFDALFLMQVAFRANWAARLINAKTKIGFDWARSKELHWLFANQRIAPQQHAHVLEGFMGFADSINVPATNELSWNIPISDDEQALAQDLLAELNSYVVISPAASKAERNWLPERYGATADYLIEKGFQVVLCGGPADLDKNLGQQIESHCQHKVTNLIGKTSLKQMLAVLKHASLVVAPDTGPAHMATTVGTDVIGLYAHSNPRRTGPYSSLQYVASVYDQVILQQTGKTWQQLPWGTRAKGQDLMKLIEVDMVIAQIDKLLSIQG